MESQKIPNSHSNPEQKEVQSCRHHTSWFQNILQNYSKLKQYGIDKRQTDGPMEQNIEARNKPMQIRATDLSQV